MYRMCSTARMRRQRRRRHRHGVGVESWRRFERTRRGARAVWAPRPNGARALPRGLCSWRGAPRATTVSTACRGTCRAGSRSRWTATCTTCRRPRPEPAGRRSPSAIHATHENAGAGRRRRAPDGGQCRPRRRARLEVGPALPRGGGGGRAAAAARGHAGCARVRVQPRQAHGEQRAPRTRIARERAAVRPFSSPWDAHPSFAPAPPPAADVGDRGGGGGGAARVGAALRAALDAPPGATRRARRASSGPRVLRATSSAARARAAATLRRPFRGAAQPRARVISEFAFEAGRYAPGGGGGGRRGGAMVASASRATPPVAARGPPRVPPPARRRLRPRRARLPGERGEAARRRCSPRGTGSRR